MDSTSKAVMNGVGISYYIIDSKSIVIPAEDYVRLASDKENGTRIYLNICKRRG